MVLTNLNRIHKVEVDEWRKYVAAYVKEIKLKENARLK
jgi:hypothetical protein